MTKSLVRRTGLMLLLAAGLAGYTGWQFTQLPTGFLPTEDQGYLLVHVQLPDAAAQERTGEVLDKVIIDVTRAHIWDISSVAALDMAVLKFRRDGADVELRGMNEASSTIVDRLAEHDKPGAMERLMGH